MSVCENGEGGRGGALLEKPSVQETKNCIT